MESRRSAPHGRVFDIHDFAATATGSVLAPGDDAEDADGLLRLNFPGCRSRQTYLNT